MGHRKRRPNLDERFKLPENTDHDEVLRRLLATPGPDEDEESEEAAE